MLSDLNDKPAFLKNLLSLVEDDDLRNELGRNSAEHVMKKFSYHRLVNDMAGLYHELLKKKKNNAVPEKK